MTKMLKNTILLQSVFLLCLWGSMKTTYAQTSNNNVEEKPYIEVTGFAEQEVIPDEIYIGIRLKERYANKVKITVSEQEDKMKSALKWLNIELSNLSLADADADYVRVPWRKKEVITEQNYTLKVSDAATVVKVFQELDKLEIKEAFIQRVKYSKMDSLRKEIEIKAIKNAKEEADYLLKAIGETTGNPLIVREVYSNIADLQIKGARTGETGYFIDGIKVRGNAGLQNEDEVQFQKIKVESRIYVKFAIK